MQTALQEKPDPVQYYVPQNGVSVAAGGSFGSIATHFRYARGVRLSPDSDRIATVTAAWGHEPPHALQQIG
jgi:hypothetical protein